MQKYGKIPESKHTPSLYFSKNRKKALYSPTFDKKPSRYHHWQHEGNKSWHLVGIAQIHAQGFPRIVHKPSVCLSRCQRLCTVGCDKHDVELSLLQHPLKLALPLSDGHHLLNCRCFSIPSNLPFRSPMVTTLRTSSYWMLMVLKAPFS